MIEITIGDTDIDYPLKELSVKAEQEGMTLSDKMKFIDESVELSPDGNGKSPNLVDSASLARNYLHVEVLGSQTKMTVGARIGG